MVRQKFVAYLLLGAVFAGSFIPARASGEDTQSDSWTLEESIEYALKHNWAVKEKAEMIVENRSAEKESKSDLLPVFSTSYSYTRLGEPATTNIPGFGDIESGDQDNYAWKATVTQPLFTGFALITTHQLAKLGIDQAEVTLALEKLELALKVKEAYFGVLKADKAVAVAESAVAALTSHQKVAQNFYEVGMSPVNDLLKSEVELANAQHELIKAQNGAGLARVSFNVLLAKSIDSPVVLEDLMTYVPESPDYETALERALKTRPEMRAMDIAEMQADRRIKLAKSNYYPEASLVANYLKQGDTLEVSGSTYQDEENWQAMVELSWTFWDWRKTKHTVSRNESAKRQLMQTRKQLEDSIRFDLKKALMDMKEAEEKIPTAKKAVAQAEENLRVSEERYKAQSTTSTEVLDAQTLLSQARMNYYNALYDHKLAKAAFKRAVGEY